MAGDIKPESEEVQGLHRFNSLQISSIGIRLVYLRKNPAPEMFHMLFTIFVAVVIVSAGENQSIHLVEEPCTHN